MPEITYTLLSDGSSDRALMPILTWALHQKLPGCGVIPRWADLRTLHRPPKCLRERIKTAVELYPCDILFIHRDSESAPRCRRIAEIERALQAAAIPTAQRPCPVVPVRMQEAWLLFCESAIRWASGNPNGRMALQVSQNYETIPHPKRELHRLLKEASGLRGRRLKALNVQELVHRVAQLIDDFSPLRGLSAFQALEQDIAGLLGEMRASIGRPP